MDAEIGRELTVAELEPGTVVVLKVEADRPLITAWVQRLGQNYVSFCAGLRRAVMLAERRGDDLYVDVDYDPPTRVRLRVYQYLGQS